MFYLTPSLTIIMKNQQISNWDKMVHAPFKKVIKFDLLCMGIGAVIGMGIGAYSVASGIFS
ncbi:hypothetical protein [Nitrosopumilus sp.]|uniref:hypothetical protein n=1 Tax=Nitrosopumilus sp. TaxID=2024843 RepID=UPI00247BD9E1|nr:hypothetical protein [Nitrosopumilus sp.]MCV0430435.1 hypothetical protein [Nitrosopumilus sp.]